MNKAYLHLIRSAHSLQQFVDDPTPDRLVGRLNTASGGESVMIRAALSLLPQAWLPDAARDLPFRLDDVGLLDDRNLRALLEAVSIQAGYPEGLYE